MKITILLILTTLFIGAATCEAVINKEKYDITVISEISRTPDVKTSIPIPPREPIALDSYYNMCIIYWDAEDNTSSEPVAGSKVVIMGDDWKVLATTEENGCLNTMIASDANFTISATNPKFNNEIAVFDGVMTSQPSGMLTTRNTTKMKQNIHDDLLDADIKYTAEKNIKEYKIIDNRNFWFTPTAIDAEKRSIQLQLPTEVGESYQIILRTDKPVKVWFGGNSRTGKNPANLTNTKPEVIKLNEFTATDIFTNLYFQAQVADRTTIKLISIKKSKK